MPVQITVTQADIAAARKWKNTARDGTYSCTCPVARAICRAYGIDPRHEVVSVDNDEVEIATPDLVCISLPDAVGHFISAFDRHDRVAPFAFDLDVDRLPDVAVVR